MLLGKLKKMNQRHIQGSRPWFLVTEDQAWRCSSGGAKWPDALDVLVQSGGVDSERGYDSQPLCKATINEFSTHDRDERCERAQGSKIKHSWLSPGLSALWAP